MVCHDDPDWMINVVQTFNVNPSGIPRNLRLEGLHVNIDDASIWYWFNLIKPKFRGADAEIALQSIFSTVGKWDQMISGQWKKNDSPFLCSPPPASVEEAMDQDETDPDPNPIQHAAGSLSLADRQDYGEGGSFSRPPADAHEL
ncbi:hypothetical protein M422DRAFT_277260 [Sphaerobolus stellatus SS14]|uniref:Uncharacterized protein n=1 Tax=Sphaerobolus stellatus (strain SS14) TaxID=990650 RepID=A0A0C9UB44_SPHS4|nr:hypothetical protein M422DRAFT_277260 [Sphaerobolus stellatus SS14]